MIKKVVYLVGGKGFVGSQITKILKKKFIIKIITKKNFKYFKKKKCDFLINANGNSKKYLADKSYLLDFKLNVLSTVKIINEFTFDKYIHLSSIDVYSDLTNSINNHENTKINFEKISNYGFNKYLSEIVVKKNVKKWNILRLSGMVGINLSKNPVYDMQNNIKLRVNINSKFHFMSTEEVANIVLKLMCNFKNKLILNLASSSNVSLRYIAKIFKYRVRKDNKKLLEKNYNINTNRLKKIYKVNSSTKTIINYLNNGNIKNSI